ncbi:hypothetical protein ACFORO_32885 [Amycolatopsis halotolerans]|uniref:Uncharacterized protein n=1 Tax=Amycolatopsis halotolerans TaxID=330083 RepID=A0ABV7QSD2_9PSEU
MGERDQVLRLLGDAGVLEGIRWAQGSAYRQVQQDFNPAGGHDQGWIGYNAYKYLLNRLDRVFQCEQYMAPDGEESVGRDVLADGMIGRDYQTMRLLPPDAVNRRDLNNSPGWMAEGWRWLLSSYKFGQVDKIRWSEKSETKATVARQPHGCDDGGLFPMTAIPALALPENPTDREREMRQTLVLAHAMDPDTLEFELFLGRSRWNADGGSAWVWKQNMLDLPPELGNRGSRLQPLDPTTPRGDVVADVELRVRRSARDGGTPRAIGEA